MNQGITLTALATELERQVSAKKDYVANTKKIAMVPTNESVSLALYTGTADEPVVGVTDLAHDQIAQHVSIPRPYYDRMLKESPALLAANVNEWLHREDEKRMVRTLDGRARAFLSSRYRPLDNYDLAMAALPALKQHGVKVISSGLTDTRLYFKGIVESLAVGLDTLGWAGSKGDALIPAIEFSNSEVGSGALSILAGWYLTSCTNLSMWKDLGMMRKYHVGRSLDEGAGEDLYTEETRVADDHALWLKVRDVIAGALQRDVFMARIATLEIAREREIVNTANLATVVEVTLRKFSLPGTLGAIVAKTLGDSRDLTAWGLSNAITAVAGSFKHDRYDLSTQMEHVGGEIIDLSADDWKVISTAQDKPAKAARPSRVAVAR